jgi:SAM-dependent methyltransferase
VPRGEVPGYREPDVFTVVECSGCRASFAQPLAVDPSIYEQVYLHRKSTPGYERYERMAEEVARQADPLAWLSRKEAMYWAVAQALRDLPRGARVLEIGSGLGYTTHSLAKAGLDAHGVDLSQEAVSHAVRRYGNRYRQGDAMQMAQQEKGAWDALIATELIEHLIDPVAFVAGIRPLLRPGGRIVLTTPDKDVYRPGTLWQSDLPPVHLWWFGADSMRKLAQRVGMSMQLLDFSEYHRAKPDAARVIWPAGEVLPRPRLRADGTPSNEAEPHGMARYFPNQRIGWQQRLRWLLYQCTPGRRPALTHRARTMGIVLRSTAS